MDEVSAVILDWVRLLLPTAFGLVVGWMTAYRKKRKEAVKHFEEMQQAQNKGILALIRKTIIDFYDLYVRHGGPMTVERRHEIGQLYEAYKTLDGNGVVDDLYDELMAEPTVVVNKQEVPIHEH